MNNKFVYITILLLLWQCAKSSNWYDITIVRKDNSFVSYYDSISFTKETPQNIRELCSVRYEQNESERNQIFEVSFNDLNIYVIISEFFTYSFRWLNIILMFAYFVKCFLHNLYQNL